MKKITLLSILLLIVTSSAIFTACKKDPKPVFHTEYFGLEQGRYVIYDVTEMIHDEALGQNDTAYYQLKTYWGDTFIDNSGRIAREFWRFKREEPTDAWEVQDLWTGIIDGVRAELVEENQRIVKLVFAPTLDKSWDANAFNMMDELECYYRDIHQDTIIGNTNLDSTLFVEQEQLYSLIDTVRKYEVYKKHIGLVHKYFKDVHFQFNSSTGEIFLDQGKELYLDFVETGFE